MPHQPWGKHQPSLSRAALSRRGVLTLGAGLGAGAGMPFLTGCTTPASEIKQAVSAVEFNAPHFIPPDKIPGALISDIEGVPPAYTRYPRPQDQVRSVARRPARGGEVSTFQVLETAPPPSDNPWRTGFAKRLGAELRPNYAAGLAYAQRLQTILASGQLPDITYLVRQDGGGAPAVVKTMQQGAFADLSDILGGAGVEAYPNLARIPTYAWRNSSVNGRILGVPRALPLVNEAIMYRADWAADLGQGKPPADADALKELLAGYTKGPHRGKKKSDDTWGLASLDHGAVLAKQMFRLPNGWRQDDNGSLTYEVETEEYEAMVVWLAELWKSGAFHPDAATLPVLEAQDLFMSGRIGMLPAGIGPHYITMLPTLHKNDPEAEVAPLILPGNDGGESVVRQGDGYWGVAAIPTALAKDTERVEELLRVIDYWCAPFGSEEYTFVNYGIEGRHFHYDDNGTPVAVTDGRPGTEVTGPTFLVQPAEAAFFYPGDAKSAKAAQEVVERAVPLSIPNPTSNLISETDIRQSAVLDQINKDYLYGIVMGRRSIKDIKEWRRRWRSAGGDTIRKEFEAGLA